MILDIPKALPQATRESLAAADSRLQSAMSAEDTEGILGACKDMTESVLKAVLDTYGIPYGANATMPELSRRALVALERHPKGIQGRESLKGMLGSISKLPVQITELRNTDGSGHGRTMLSDLRAESAVFVAQVAPAFCNWTMQALGAVLGDLADASEAAEGIGGPEIFHRHELAVRLDSLDIESLPPPAQRVLGLAVGRRAAGGTFVVDYDVLIPLSEGDITFPVAFVEGLLEGLFVNRDGEFQAIWWSIERIPGICSQLDPESAVFEGIVDLVRRTSPRRLMSGESLTRIVDEIDLVDTSAESLPWLEAVREVLIADVE